MKYKVLVRFVDNEDGHVYDIGDMFPHEGFSPSVERIAYLQSKDTAFGKPVIEKPPKPKNKEEKK